MMLPAQDPCQHLVFPIPSNPLLGTLLDDAALGVGQVKQHCWDLPTTHAMPQDTGLPDGSESRPLAGRLSLPPKKRELMERKALLAEDSPEQPISGNAMAATLCQWQPQASSSRGMQRMLTAWQALPMGQHWVVAASGHRGCLWKGLGHLRP